MVMCNPEIRIKYEHKKDNYQFVFDTNEFNKNLNILKIDQIKKLKYLKEQLKEKF